MNKDAKITSIFATIRNGQAVMNPTAAALKRAENIPPVETYPATHAVLDIEFNRHFGEGNNIHTRPAEIRAGEFHQFCNYLSQQAETTRKHYHMFTTKGAIPDTVLACCLNFYAALEIPLGADNGLAAIRSHAAQIHLIWDQQTEVRQKDVNSLDENNRFIFMDILAKRLDLFLDNTGRTGLFDEAKTSQLLRSIRKAGHIDFGDTPLARKIRENMHVFNVQYRSLLRMTSSTGANILPITTRPRV